jgi:hypothetical protein
MSGPLMMVTCQTKKLRAMGKAGPVVKQSGGNSQVK